LAAHGPKRIIEFNNCTIEHTKTGTGIHVEGKSADSARLRFLNCRYKYVETREDDSGEADKDQPAPIVLTTSGGIDFMNCSVHDTLDRPAVVIDDKGSGAVAHDLTGEVTVYNPHGARMDVRCKTSKMELEVRE